MSYLNGFRHLLKEFRAYALNPDNHFCLVLATFLGEELSKSIQLGEEADFNFYCRLLGSTSIYIGSKIMSTGSMECLVVDRNIKNGLNHLFHFLQLKLQNDKNNKKREIICIWKRETEPTFISPTQLEISFSITSSHRFLELLAGLLEHLNSIGKKSNKFSIEEVRTEPRKKLYKLQTSIGQHETIFKLFEFLHQHEADKKIESLQKKSSLPKTKPVVQKKPEAKATTATADTHRLQAIWQEQLMISENVARSIGSPTTRKQSDFRENKKNLIHEFEAKLNNFLLDPACQEEFKSGCEDNKLQTLEAQILEFKKQTTSETLKQHEGFIRLTIQTIEIMTTPQSATKPERKSHRKSTTPTSDSTAFSSPPHSPELPIPAFATPVVPVAAAPDLPPAQATAVYDTPANEEQHEEEDFLANLRRRATERSNGIVPTW